MIRSLFVSLLLAQSCRAHLPSSSTLTLDGAVGTWTVPLAVLDDAWLIDADSDGKLSASEWQTLEEHIRREMTRSFFPAGSLEAATVNVTAISPDTTGTASQVIVKFTLPEKPAPVQCRLLAVDDPLHRVVLK